MLRLSLLAVLSWAIPLSAAPLVRVLAWDESVAARQLAFVSAGAAIEITGMHPLKRTEPVKTKGGGPFAVRALDKEPGPDGKPLDITCRIPATMLHPLLVLLPDESHPTGIRPLIVDDNPLGFRWGSYRFLNATPKELFVQLENKAIRAPAGWKPVDVRLGGDSRGFGARIALAADFKQPLYTAVWEYNPDVRILCFIVPGTDPRLGPVVFKAIPEDRRSLELAIESAKPPAKPE